MALKSTQPPVKCIHVALSLWKEQPWHEYGQTFLSSAEVKNGGAITLLPR
jgi:hypothetical protein